MDQAFEANEIVSGLFLGNKSNTSSKDRRDLLVSLGFTHVLVVANDAPVFNHPGLTFTRYQVNDDPREDLSKIFDECADLIQQVVSSGHSILVHCYAGVSRSATIVCAYLIKYHSMTADEALVHTQNQRPIVCPNSGFMKQLDNFLPYI